MNPQMAILMALLGGGAGGQPFDTGAGNQMSSNSEILNALQGHSPVNVNPNYASTVSRFFNRSPLSGSPAFTGASPMQSGAAGNNASRAQTGHSSFMPTDFSNAMQKWVGP